MAVEGIVTSGVESGVHDEVAPADAGDTAAPAVEARALRLDPERMRPVVNRIKRAQGQLAGIVRLLEEGRDCEEVIVQLAAVSRALDRAGFTIVSTSLQQCLARGAGPDSVDARNLERLFLSLA